jgi:hypothetical protein
MKIPSAQVGVVVHACNPNIQMTEENGEFKASLGYIARHYFEKNEWVVREGVRAGGRNDPSLVCTYE